MRCALDSNILSSLWSNEPSAPRVQAALQSASHRGLVLLCPVVFSEVLAHPTASEKGIQQFLLETGIQVDYHHTDAFWHTAGLAYAQYAARRRKSSGDQPRRIVADYLIGAHALLNADSLMTLDPSTYQRDFPNLRLITP